MIRLFAHHETRERLTASAPGLAHASANQVCPRTGRLPLRNESSAMIGVPFDRLKVHGTRSGRLGEQPEPEHHSTVMKIGAVNSCFQCYLYFFATVDFAG